MEPTLLVGDVLLVDKLRPRFGEALHRIGVDDPISTARPGDVVLFPPPPRLMDVVNRESSGGSNPIRDRSLFVKRVVAREGDRVAVNPKSGAVTVNGELVKGRDQCSAEPLRLIERYLAMGTADWALTPGEEAEQQQQQQRRLEGAEEIEGGRQGEDLGGSVQQVQKAAPPAGRLVPKNELFVMGDCSDVSIDSRVWGGLSSEQVVGRPILRIWPPSRAGVIPPLRDGN